MSSLPGLSYWLKMIFSTFLKSKGAAKAELLEKLTGTGVYSRISQEVFLRNKLVQEEVTTIRNRMSVIDLLPEEELLALQKEKELLIAKRAVGFNYWRNRMPG